MKTTGCIIFELVDLPIVKKYILISYCIESLVPTGIKTSSYHMHKMIVTSFPISGRCVILPINLDHPRACIIEGSLVLFLFSRKTGTNSHIYSGYDLEVR